MKKIFITIIIALYSGIYAKAQEFDNVRKVAVVILLDGDEGKKTVTTVYTTIYIAQSIGKTLGIEIKGYEENDDDNVFIFNVISEEQREMTLKMFDREGCEYATNRTMKAEEKNTYTPNNSDKIEDNTFMFELKDADVDEYIRSVKTDKNK